MEPTRCTDPFCSSFTTTRSWNLPGLPWPCSFGRLAALATLFVPPEAQNGQKGSQKSLSAVPTITAATTATNCLTTTLSWNLPGLPWPCSLGRLAALATLFVVPEAQNGQKGSPKGLSAVPTITAATTATNCFTNCFTTTLPGWPCSLGRLAALATLFVPPWAQNNQKGSPKGLSAVPTITAATTATNCFITTLLPTLFVPSGQKGSPKGLSAAPITTALLLIA